MTDQLPNFTPRFSTAWKPPVSKAQRLEDERDAARNALAAANRKIAELSAVNDVLMRIFGEAIDHAVTEPIPTERNEPMTENDAPIAAADHDGTAHRDPVDVITPEWIAELSEGLNRCDDAGQAIAMAIGSATMCWEHVERAGCFQSQRALVIAEVLNAHLRGRRDAELTAAAPR